jgi:hypothetical protein
MSDEVVRKWVRKFNEGRDNMHDEPRSVRPSVVSDVFTGGYRNWYPVMINALIWWKLCRKVV